MCQLLPEPDLLDDFVTHLRPGLTGVDSTPGQSRGLPLGRTTRLKPVIGVFLIQTPAFWRLRLKDDNLTSVGRYLQLTPGKPGFQPYTSD